MASDCISHREPRSWWRAFCSHPIATSAANDPVTLPAFAALCHLLMNGGS